MKVVILCGGKGTRLREETEYRPKPLVGIGGKPILWHIMKMYSAYGFRDFVLCLGYKGEMIKDYFINYDLLNSDFTIELGSKRITRDNVAHDEADWRVSLVDTGLETMTGGRLSAVRKYVQSDDAFMVTYGDGVSDVNITNLLDFHRRSGRTATLTGVHPVGRFGELALEGDAVRLFAEKPASTDRWINGGFFVMSPKIFDYIDGENCTFEHEPLEQLSREDQLGVYRHPGYWQCMDNPKDMDLLNNEWASGSAPWKVWSESNESELPRLLAA